MTRQVGIRFTDNQSGAGATIQVHVGNHQSLSTLLANTEVAKGGSITSAELQSNFQGAVLIVKDNGQQIGKADGNGNNQTSFTRTPISQLTIDLSG